VSSNTTLNANTTTGDTISTDAITTLNGVATSSGEKTQRVKVGFGTNSFFRDVDVSNGLPVSVFTLPTDSTTYATLQGILLDVAVKSEFIAVSALVSTIGDNVLYTPASGKKIRLRWCYALNDPSSSAPARITIKLGTLVKSITYGISRMQVDTGPVDGTLIVNLSQAANVACTFRLEEI
jgi:hypothetical protein